MASEIGDGEHLVAERRHQQQVHLGEDACHLNGHFAPQPVGLNEVHCREESSLAELLGDGLNDGDS
jgi:hypothetical protein